MLDPTSLQRRLGNGFQNLAAAVGVKQTDPVLGDDDKFKDNHLNQKYTTAFKFLAALIIGLLLYSLSGSVFTSDDMINVKDYPHFKWMLDRYDRKNNGMWQDDRSNCCGPWLCAIYDNEDFRDQPVKVVRKEQLVTNWQETPVWSYDGVPELHHKKQDFSMRCSTVKRFEVGFYTFMGRITGATGHFGSSFDGGEVHNLVTPGGWQAPPMTHTLEVDKAGYGTILFEIKKDNSNYRASGILTWVKSMRLPSSLAGDETRLATMSPAQKAACITSPNCWNTHADQPVCPDDSEKGKYNFWFMCKPWLQEVRAFEQKKQNGGCIVYAVGLGDDGSIENVYAQEGCEVHVFDCLRPKPSSLAHTVIWHDWCVTLDSNNKEHQGKLISTLAESMAQLRHEYITVLKFDCDGCEWEALANFGRLTPARLNSVSMIKGVFNFPVDGGFPNDGGQQFQNWQVEVATYLKNFRGFRVNFIPDVSKKRPPIGSQPPIFQALRKSGVMTDTYQLAWVHQGIGLSTTEVMQAEEDAEKAEVLGE